MCVYAVSDIPHSHTEPRIYLESAYLGGDKFLLSTETQEHLQV